MTFDEFHKSLISDQLWMETMAYVHKGKDIEQGIKEALAHLIADPDRLKNANLADCKRLVNGWLSNRKAEQVKVKRDISKL